MSISVNWVTRIIFVPQSYLSFVSGSTYTLDTNQFRLDLKDLEDDAAEGMAYPDTHRHNLPVTLSGVIYSRILEFINGYQIEFEDGPYRVSLLQSNNNIGDVAIVNRVSIQVNNSAGLIVGDSSGASAQEVWDYLIGDGIAAKTALLGSFQALLNNSTIVPQTGGGNLVTVFAEDGVTPAFQFGVSEDGKVRTRL